MLKKVDHIAIAVRSIAEALPYYEKVLGLSCERIEEVPSQKVKTAFLKIGELHLELLEPTSPESTVQKFLDKNGPGVHHVAFATDNLEEQLAQAKGAGCALIHETPVDGAGDKQIAFLHPKSTQGVLTEFCMPKKSVKSS
jgi:methylmalonyl-CoA/ethylmalonyl-CoA epimerase